MYFKQKIYYRELVIQVLEVQKKYTEAIHKQLQKDATTPRAKVTKGGVIRTQYLRERPCEAVTQTSEDTPSTTLAAADTFEAM